jgi:hypothetical protein
MKRRKDIQDELIEISPELANLNVSNPYKVPAGYFDNLAEAIMLRIKTQGEESAKEELENISPLLGGMKKTMPFSVPEGYFEKLSPEIPKQARVVSLKAGKLFKYAAAAVTIGLITVMAWFFIKTPSGLNNGLAINNDSTTVNQIQNNFKNISDSEIAGYIDNVGMNNIENETADLNDEDVQLMLADVSDKELEKYLEQHTSEKPKMN